MTKNAAIAAFAMLLFGRPASAQSDPALALRPFVIVTAQAFTAKETFEAGFGESIQPFYGGGLSLVTNTGFFLDITASRFRKTGERVFRNGDDTFPLGIPLSVTITPLEFSFGYRFRTSRAVVPYFGGGLGSYRYQETSDEADPSEEIDTRKGGYLAVGGVDFRAAPWFRVGVDVQYTLVTGILGEGGFSQQVGEDDLGGLAARLKFTVGR
jgi:hypothetical protein